MRNNNMRGAWWALGLAGAAYLWKNRGKLRQQYNNMQQQHSQERLPDYQQDNQSREVGEQRSYRRSNSPFGGTEV